MNVSCGLENNVYSACWECSINVNYIKLVDNLKASISSLIFCQLGVLITWKGMLESPNKAVDFFCFSSVSFCSMYFEVFLIGTGV